MSNLFKTERVGRLVVCGFLLLQVTFLFSQLTIADARLKSVGSTITTSGTITSGPEFGQIRFMQDATAGISVYSTSLSATVPGDSIFLTGVLSLYRGQLEITPVNSFHVIQSGRPLPVPEEIELGDPSNTMFESMRVTLPCIGVSSCDSYFDSYWYTMFDSKGIASKLVMAQTGMPVPSHGISATGLWVNVDNDFQLWCESSADVSEGTCKIIPKATVSFDAQHTDLTWDVSGSSNAWVEYGIDQFDQVKSPVTGNNQTTVSFDQLTSGQIYKGRLGQTSVSLDTFYSLPTYFSTPSIPTVPIAIYFDRPVDPSYSDGSHPAGFGPSTIETDVINRIDQVHSTLDVAMYNTTRTSIVDAVERAVQRGVRVRYIAESSNSNSALQGSITFPVLYRQGDGIMHNKFMVADVDDSQNAWLWTGSTNFTTSQLATDPNHAYVIHDQALAMNYRIEFDELWGTSPDHTGAKEGQQKIDNTAHLFNIDNTNIESYFSPSDETSCHILDALKSADHQALIGLLLLTKDDLVDEIIALYQKGVDVRVILADEGNSSLALARLRQAGVKVAIHTITGLFHHKYAIIDEGYPDSDPLVITGSHNWTLSADIVNDENTLIIHDQSVANIFRQEYEARWSELNTTATIPISQDPLLTLHPNPASDLIEMTNPSAEKCTITLINVAGNIMGHQKLAPHQTISYVIDPGIPNGIYLVHWLWQDNHAVSKLVIQR